MLLNANNTSKDGKTVHYSHIFQIYEITVLKKEIEMAIRTAEC